jgi:hypothetical protein
VPLRTQFSERRIDYDGSQLRSGWLQESFGLDVASGGALAAFVGGCDVKPEFVVDLDEVASGEPIRAESMLHFIAEFPESDIEKVALRQRLLAAVVRDELAARLAGFLTAEGAEGGEGGSRRGEKAVVLPSRKGATPSASSASPSTGLRAVSLSNGSAVSPRGVLR